MAARRTALSTARTILGQPARLAPQTAKALPAVSQLHSSAVTLSATSSVNSTPFADDAPIPGATYVHIPPLEIPAEGLVPSQGSAQIRAVIGMNGPTLTVAHSLAIIKAIEAKCGPVVYAHHRRDPVNGTLLRRIDIKLLHPITLTQPLVLEIPCPKISREHRLQGGPSLDEVERAILERPSSMSTASSSRKGAKNATTGVLHEDYDVVFAEVETVAAKIADDAASKYGVNRLPAERKRGIFTSRVQRGRKKPEEEKKEDEEILERLMDWDGFYGGFEGLQEAYRPLSAVLPARAVAPGSATEQNVRSTSTPTSPPKVQKLSPSELAAQKEADKRALEEKLVAEREYWRQRRETEKTMQTESSTSDNAARLTPSPTLLQRLLEGDNEKTAASTSSAASSDETSSVKLSKTETVASHKDSPVPLNKAQTRLVDQARQRAREESSPSLIQKFPFLTGGKTSQQVKPEPQSSSAASKGFKPDAPSKDTEEGTLESWAQWFKKRV
ncbi:hypothetical protein NliqN6_2789 [Naganishia liquefaciens]|uniref:Uncharacterized protein n=1 Tax=Naganishia liquefaciens TaxID=104408 RepID=A0A8H3TSI0_9TREE|nr:hypothetical protein NliqN6_2789 [Naganishia liquefaciens]